VLLALYANWKNLYKAAPGAEAANTWRRTAHVIRRDEGAVEIHIDGAADHLWNMSLPRISLRSRTGRLVDLSDLRAPRTVIFCYPMSEIPEKTLLAGWDMIPDAHECTPQTCGFRDRHQELSKLRADVFGLSTQTTEYQREMAGCLQLPFCILSDAEFSAVRHSQAVDAPGGRHRLVKRRTFIVRQNRIEQLVSYPVFPPKERVDRVLSRLREHPFESGCAPE